MIPLVLLLALLADVNDPSARTVEAGRRLLLPEDLSDDDRWEVLQLAVERGLACDSGYCGAAALALNDVLFSRRGELVAVANRWYWERKRQFVGHVGVLWKDQVWDGTMVYEGGVDDDRFLAWAQIAPGDSDHPLPRRREWEAGHEIVLLRGSDALRAVRQLGLRGIPEREILRDALEAFRRGERA